MAAPEATQAAAADERFVYAIANKVVAKYDRATGRLLERSTGDATHLNTGYFLDGKMYCAHSNFPSKPEHSEIKVLDPAKMVLLDGEGFWRQRWQPHLGRAGRRPLVGAISRSTAKRMPKPISPSSTIGAKSRGGFIRRGDQVVRREQRVVRIWQDGRCWSPATTSARCSVLTVPEEGRVLRHVATVAAPFTGQGFATDPKTGGLIGIDRAQRQIIFAERSGR